MSGLIFGQGGINPETIKAFFTGSGLLGMIIVIGYLVLKHRVFRIVSIDSGTVLLRVRWGRSVRYRFGAKRGRLMRLDEGPHLLVRGIHDGWEIPLKEVIVVDEDVLTADEGSALYYNRITVGYQVIDRDDLVGDEHLLNYVLKLRNIDRDDQVSLSMDEKMFGLALAGQDDALQNLRLTAGQLVPRITIKDMPKSTRKQLKEHGVRLTTFTTSQAVRVVPVNTVSKGRVVMAPTTYEPEPSGNGEVAHLPSTHTA